MEKLSLARNLFREGRYAEALEQANLGELRFSNDDDVLLLAELNAVAGDLSLASAPVSRMLRKRDLSERYRAKAELLLSRVAAEYGDLSEEAERLQRALAQSERGKCLDVTIQVQMRHLALAADRDGSESCQALLSKLRQNVTAAGDSSLTAGLHLVVADADGKHGLIRKSLRHVEAARSILDRFPNAWLTAWSESTLLALSIVQSDLSSAMLRGTRALAAAKKSGARAIERSVLANIGRLHYLSGDFAAALSNLEAARDTCHAGSPVWIGIQESIARVHFSEQRYEKCAELLGAVDITDRTDVTTGSYIHRHALLTKAETYARIGRTVEALRYFDEAVTLARTAGDSVLEDAAVYLRDEFICAGSSEARQASGCSQLTVPKEPTVESTVLYERATAARLLSAGEVLAAGRHRARAQRVCRASGNFAAELELDRAWQALGETYRPVESIGADLGSLFQELSCYLTHAGRPELAGETLMALLRHGGFLAGAEVVQGDAQTCATLSSWGPMTDDESTTSVLLGLKDGERVELRLQPSADPDSAATLGALQCVATAVRDLEQARRDREDGATLWPTEELPAEGDDSVVAGKMREVMAYARRIAPARVTVLITGESGTGKEVLARAIHRYSSRATRPFVPFNCTAVPRDLVESHLFGFRKGSFTGADRDNPGLIRAAKDGTLFLDEIGDLGLDLQPKLLRFIESGEIHPIGEPMPFAVNVRIVAATNANLKQMVKDGKFREDLYYRLNVIPIELPPLRERREEIPALARHLVQKWAHELGKGHIRISETLMEHLVLCPWPGNIRQLSNEINRMVAHADAGQSLSLADYGELEIEASAGGGRAGGDFPLRVVATDNLGHAIATLEREMITRALREHDGRMEAAAKALGISRKGLYLKRQRLGL